MTAHIPRGCIEINSTVCPHCAYYMTRKVDSNRTLSRCGHAFWFGEPLWNWISDFV